MDNKTMKPLEELTVDNVPIVLTDLPGPRSRAEWGRENRHASPGLSAVAALSQIVLDQGRLAEQGTHHTLMAQGGLYWRLYRADGPGGPQRHGQAVGQQPEAAPHRPAPSMAPTG